MLMPQRSSKHCANDGDFDFFGATGPLMRDAGVETIVNSDELAIMGIVEVGRVFQKFIKAFRKLKAAAIEQSPDAVVLVDWPEFNLRLASTSASSRFKSDLLHQSAIVGVAAASYSQHQTRRGSAVVDPAI